MVSRFNLDPHVFDPQTVDPEMEAFNGTLEQTLSAGPPLHTMSPSVLRYSREAGQSIWGDIKLLPEMEDRLAPSKTGGVPIRVFVPEEVRGVYMYLHGGGFMLGRAFYSDEILAALARSCSLAVLSVDYRLAPENPYPAAPDDCEAVALWLAREADREFGTRRLLIGGESAGANLGVVTLLRMRDRHDFTGFYGANLCYGNYDLNLTPSGRMWGERPSIINTPLIEWFHENYVSRDKYNDPDVSPLYADLDGLPRALFTVGTMDPLLDDTLFMFMRWLAAGNEAELEVYPGAPHAFNAFPLKMAERANGRIEEFLRRAAG